VSDNIFSHVSGERPVLGAGVSSNFASIQRTQDRLDAQAAMPRPQPKPLKPVNDRLTPEQAAFDAKVKAGKIVWNIDHTEYTEQIS
jgi:hypothetical protein